MKGRLSFNTLLIVFSVVILVALATWVVPGGEYRREVKDGKTLVVPGSFVYGDSRPQGPGAVLAAPLFFGPAPLVAVTGPSST